MSEEWVPCYEAENYEVKMVANDINAAFRFASERKINDKHKKEICSAYNIRLIEWRYDEIITKLVLDEKLKGGIVYG